MPFSKAVLICAAVLVLLFGANTINIGADLSAMGERGVKEAIVDGVLAAAARSVELGDEFGR